MLQKAAGFLILLGSAAMAQEIAPAGFLHGGLMAWNGTPRAGEFTFQTVGGHVFVCTYDDKTYVERENQRIHIGDADKGDHLEIVTDHRDASTCYARLVHVLENPKRYVVPGVRPRPRPAGTPLFQPHANLSFSGTVYQITPASLVLRSRSGERQTLRLRSDTYYLCDGQAAEARNLQVNTVVFVRGARDLYGVLEAYQVIWGGILQPVR